MPMLAAGRASRSDRAILNDPHCRPDRLGRRLRRRRRRTERLRLFDLGTPGGLPAAERAGLGGAGRRARDRIDHPRAAGTVVDGGFQPYEFYEFQEFAHTVYEGSVQGSPTTLDVQITELASPQKAMTMYNDTQYASSRPPPSRSRLRSAMPRGWPAASAT